MFGWTIYFPIQKSTFLYLRGLTENEVQNDPESDRKLALPFQR
ncbi:hypothetical protein DFQ06_3029 [Algibacter lectus]|uniref:Uncharacterized protein n=1 Tax=Algibacter lectus TaxID=221126 RepID=A0A4R8M6L8_9FLAO|nr:hypothetical protein DFQ06_3029 [Algibacter lectus]